MPFTANTAEGPRHFDGLLTRAKFDELTQDLVERAVVITQKVMDDAGVTNMDLDEVFLIGGSSRIPAVREKIGLLTVKVPNMSLNTDECGNWCCFTGEQTYLMYLYMQIYQTDRYAMIHLPYDDLSIRVR